MLLDVSTRATGPLFDGRARAAANAYVNRLERQLAEEGLNILRVEMRAVFRNPTGYYESRCRVEDGRRITDSRVVYGPWLAGVGSRNFPVTRFKGYDHWIRTRHQLNERKVGLGERLLRRYTGRM
ncbi:hypothetical protein GPA10_05240 [Streptomyces sp. p1417]|uniref:Uncharacterized protein n=1 Tax=Streptomyces typhae TaxID=2681492 RepID=A0A6L6WW08_9ACTN|nr:hypothetical protein [Streptomyces typhae]MVO84191.1 hypothetical protein [Streptomyces typhae]